MKKDRSTRRGPHRIAVAAFATAAVLPMTAATASATTAGDFIECSEGSISVTVNTTTKAVTGSGTATDCVAQVGGNVHSATITITGTAKTIGSHQVSTVTTETIRWNTGATTTVTVNRSYYGNSNVSGVGLGKTTAGAYSPGDEFDSGDGTRRAVSGGISLVKENQLIVTG